MAKPLPDPERLLESLVAAMRPRVGADARLVGIHTGGAWVAERLHRALGITAPLGLLAIVRRGEGTAPARPLRETRRSHMPFEVEGRELVLVDDVLHSGRTVRAALNALWEFGRPRRVLLAVLADRGGHELPIAPDFTGGLVEVGPGESLVLTNEGGRLRLAAVTRPA
jgi:pyrimidine operon attenuation protein/uracil phosphoribosyltransferase